MSTDVPLPDEVTGPWWEATRERRLFLQSCQGCGSPQHPPRALCAGCGRTDALGWIEASGDGRVDASTVVHRAPVSGLRPPYVVARVRLEEGPLLLTNVVTDDPDAVGIGDRVHVDWRPLDDGRALPVFVPVPDPEET